MVTVEHLKDREWVQMNDLADEENFILAFPQGTDLEGSPHWNAQMVETTTSDDKGFVLELIEQSDGLQCRRRQSLAAGYPTQFLHLACTAETFCHWVCVWYPPRPWFSCNPYPMGMINLHGTQDGVAV